MFRTIFLLAFTLATSSVLAQSAALLAKHPPVNEFLMETIMAKDIDCTLLALKMETNHLTGGSAADYESLSPRLYTCIAKVKETPREKLILALTYLKDRPGASSSLKTYYLKWTSNIDNIRPISGESLTARNARQNKSAQELRESLRAFELELELGT